MHINKKQISHNFSKAVSSYEMAASVQKKSAYFLVDFFLRNTHNKKIYKALDIGTGTGFVIDALLPQFPHANYTINDISQEMINYTQKKHPFLSYIHGDAEKICFSPSDLIISNLTFQWFSSLEAALLSLLKSTKSLCFSIPIKGSFDSYQFLYESINEPSPLLIFPSQKEIEDICSTLKPKHIYLETNTYELSFPNPSTFIRHLHQLGAHTSTLSNKSALKKILAIKGPLLIRYVVLFVLLERNN